MSITKLLLKLAAVGLLGLGCAEEQKGRNVDQQGAQDPFGAPEDPGAAMPGATAVEAQPGAVPPCQPADGSCPYAETHSFALTSLECNPSDLGLCNASLTSQAEGLEGDGSARQQCAAWNPNAEYLGWEPKQDNTTMTATGWCAVRR